MCLCVCTYSWSCIYSYLQDTSVSVRKRVIKIFKDICLQEHFPKQIDVYGKMLRRIGDEEGVKVLWGCMWFVVCILLSLSVHTYVYVCMCSLTYLKCRTLWPMYSSPSGSPSLKPVLLSWTKKSKREWQGSWELWVHVHVYRHLHLQNIHTYIWCTYVHNTHVCLMVVLLPRVCVCACVHVCMCARLCMCVCV